MYNKNYHYLYILQLFLLHTITCNPILVQKKPFITSTNETSISICTFLGAIMCSVTTLINIWLKQSIHMCKNMCLLVVTCMHGYLYMCTYHCM